MKIWKEIENGEKLKIEGKIQTGKNRKLKENEIWEKIGGYFFLLCIFFPMYSKKRLLLSKKKC